MESTFLELKVMSCGDLRNFQFFHKLSAHCIVSIVDVEKDGKKIRKQKILQQQTTAKDSTGGRNPEWNHLMKFDLTNLPLKSGRVYVRFNIRAESLISGNRTIGEVCVPVNNLIEESKGAEAARFVKYQIRTLHGRPNGVISFSYKANFNGKKSNESYTKEANSLQGFEFPSEKIKYPKVEKTVCYPVIDDEYDSLQEKNFQSHKLYYRSLELHGQVIQFSSPPPVSYYATPAPMYFAAQPAYFQSLPPSPYHPTAPPAPYHVMASNYAVCDGYRGV